MNPVATSWSDQYPVDGIMRAGRCMLVEGEDKSMTLMMIEEVAEQGVRLRDADPEPGKESESSWYPFHKVFRPIPLNGPQLRTARDVQALWREEVPLGIVWTTVYYPAHVKSVTSGPAGRGKKRGKQDPMSGEVKVHYASGEEMTLPVAVDLNMITGKVPTCILPYPVESQHVEASLAALRAESAAPMSDDVSMDAAAAAAIPTHATAEPSKPVSVAPIVPPSPSSASAAAAATTPHVVTPSSAALVAPGSSGTKLVIKREPQSRPVTTPTASAVPQPTAAVPPQPQTVIPPAAAAAPPVMKPQPPTIPPAAAAAAAVQPFHNDTTSSPPSAPATQAAAQASVPTIPPMNETTAAPSTIPVPVVPSPRKPKKRKRDRDRDRDKEKEKDEDGAGSAEASWHLELPPDPRTHPLVEKWDLPTMQQAIPALIPLAAPNKVADSQQQPEEKNDSEGPANVKMETDVTTGSTAIDASVSTAPSIPVPTPASASVTAPALIQPSTATVSTPPHPLESSLQSEMDLWRRSMKERRQDEEKRPSTDLPTSSHPSSSSSSSSSMSPTPFVSFVTSTGHIQSYDRLRFLNEKQMVAAPYVLDYMCE